EMRCDTDIKVNILLGRYKFIYRGLEVWKDRRLLRLDSQTDDNNKRYIVSAIAEMGGLRVKVNNVERLIKADVWSSSYWCLPDARFRNTDVTILDADDGKDFTSRLQFVAAEKMRVAMQDTVLHHYRLTGKVTIDLWYDGNERLIRQEWMEQGQKTVMDLVRV